MDIEVGVLKQCSEKNCSPFRAGKYSKSMKQSRRWCHTATKGKSGLEAEQVRALGALRRLWSKQKLSADKRRETHFSSNEAKETWIKDHVERETAVARKWVQNAERLIMQEQEKIWNVENTRLTTTKPEKTLEEMLNAIGDSLSDLACSDNEEDGEDEDIEDDTELGELSEDDEPGWVMGTISKSVQLHMESFRQKQMRLDKLMEPRWADMADYFNERNMKYGTTKLNVSAVVKPQTDMTTPKPWLTWSTYAESWYRPQIIKNAASDVSTRKYSNEAGFGETTGTQSHSTSHAWHGTRFVTDEDCEACWTWKLVPLYMASLANYHIEIGFGRQHGDGFCSTWGIGSQIGVFDDISRIKAIFVPILLCVRFF